MSANLQPISSDGGFITNQGNVIVGDDTAKIVISSDSLMYQGASPAPSITGFDSANFPGNVTSSNVSLVGGYIKGGVDTIVDDGINAIYTGSTTTMDVYGFPFTQITRGLLNISGDITPAEALGTWYYQSINTTTFEIFTDSTYTTPVDSTSWASYSGGGIVAITKLLPAANIVIDSNGFLTKFDNTGNLIFPDNTVQATAWTGTLPNPTYSGSDAIGEATPAPLNLNNSAEATLLTQLNLINTGGGAGSGSAIDFWTYTSINDVPEVRLQAVDDGNYSANFSIALKGTGNSGNNGLATEWKFGTDGNLTLPGNTFTVNYANGTQVSLDSASSNISNGTSNVSIPTINGNIVTNVNGSAILTTYSGGIKVGGSGFILSPGGAGSITLNNNGANIPTANITTQLNVTGASGANITANLTAGNISTAGNFSGNTNGFTIGYLNIPQVAASNTTLALTDAGKHYYSTTAGNFTLTVPNNTSASFATGTAISIVVQAAGNILVNAASGVTMYMAGNSTAANRVVGGYGMATLMKVATDTWFINGTGVS